MKNCNSQNEDHSGHRKRMRDKLMRNGAGSFQEHELLEILLFYAMPRRDTNHFAHQIIDQFKDIKTFVNTPYQKLKQEGISENMIALLELMRYFSEQKFFLEPHQERKVYDHKSEICDKLIKQYMGQAKEAVTAIFLDNQQKEIDSCIIRQGSVEACDMYIKELTELCVNKNATGVILAHNHPSGNAVPSIEDVNTTRKVQEVLNSVNIRLIDHIIVGNSDIFSMSDSSQYDDIFS